MKKKCVTLPNAICKIASVFCGCGSPALAWKTVHEYLQNYSLIGDDWAQRTLNLETGEQYIVAYLLDHLGLIEHGSSIGGSWLTDDGKQALEFLDRWGDEWRDLAGTEFVSADGVNHSSVG